MKQKQRILDDVYECLRFYEMGHFDEKGTIESIAHITKPKCCEHCIFQPVDCENDHEKTCAKGWAKYLESEAK